jgi:hypothetical protein
MDLDYTPEVWNLECPKLSRSRTFLHCRIHAVLAPTREVGHSLFLHTYPERRGPPQEPIRTLRDVYLRT